MQTKYLVKTHLGYVSLAFGTQKTAATASKFWTLDEATYWAERKGGNVERTK